MIDSKHTKGRQGFSERQYEFRKFKSTTDAIERVMDTARETIKSKKGRRGLNNTVQLLL